MKSGFKNKKIVFIILIVIGIMISIVITLAFNTEDKLSLEEYLTLGEKYLLELDYEKAIVTFNKILKIDPMNVRGYTGLADAYIGTGNIEKAIEVLEKGIGVLSGDSSSLEKKLRILRLEAFVAENWVGMDSKYYDVCEEILELFETEQIEEIPSYMRKNLAVPLREESISEDERIIMYYGDVKDGMPEGKGICIYSKGVKERTEGYVGEFKGGMRSGTGLAIFTSQHYQGYYFGVWHSDIVHGSGAEYIDSFGYDGADALPDGIYDRYSIGTTNMGSAEGYWLEGFYENGKIRVEDNNERNGTRIAGYQYLCVDGKPVPFGKVSQDAWWFGIRGYGIDTDAGDLMVKTYIVFEDGTEIFREAPHEHAGGVGCKICRNFYENYESGQVNHFHAWEQSDEIDMWIGFYIE